MLKLTEKQWARLHTRLAEEYRDEPSVLIVRDKMRRVLGCVVRRHRMWIKEQAHKGSKEWVWPQDWIYLDFYDDAKETFFCLKYAEYL